MFVIFGFGHKKVKVCGNTNKTNCNRCNNLTELQLLKVVTYFTLFFIPLIPYKTTYLQCCPICRDSIELSKYEFEQMIDSEPVYTGNRNGQAAGERDKYAGKTETQINFLKQMEELDRNRG